MTKFEEPIIKVVRFATPDVLTLSSGLDDTDVLSGGGYGDMKDSYNIEGDPFGYAV